MWRNTAIVFLAAAILVPLSACQLATPEEAAEKQALPSAEEIVDGVAQALKDLKTYRFDADRTMKIAVESEAEAFQATTVMEVSGTLDIEAGRIRTTTTIEVNMVAPGEDVMRMEMNMYLMEDAVYILAHLPQMGNISMWLKSEMPEGTWEQMSQVEPQIELLQAAVVSVIGTDTVRGVDCYLIEVAPDPEQLWELFMEWSQVTSQELPEVEEDSMKEIVEGFSVKQWIAKTTFYLIKSEIEMTLEMTPEAMGFPDEEGSLTMEIAMSLLAYDYNQPVSIELPPEAEDAIEVDADELPW
ncbi:MAG: hypothetical protein ISS55_02035 [Dehalococcoidales bacterium]|nr:hypothetical protein [Dehalococcoidales bacterium]